ncbi:MAG: hypothetical protein GC159_02110 [Phycisphaera sp.]|nr:hypothetical protein [Phycisphaera sp.]
MLSKRERTLGLLAAVALGVLVLNAYALQPWIEHSRALSDKAEALSLELDGAVNQIDAKKSATRRWREMTSAGMHVSRSEAESQLLHAMRGWSSSARLNLVSIKPERSYQTGEMTELVYHASASGRMDAVARFLYAMETADLPVHIRQMQISTAKAGSDELTLDLRVSTLCHTGEPAKPTKGGK